MKPRSDDRGFCLCDLRSFCLRCIPEGEILFQGACLNWTMRQRYILAVTPVDYAMIPIRRVRGALRSFHPSALPPMVRASYGREMMAWWFLSMMLGAIEGGVMSVIVKKGYAGVGGISPSQLN